MHFASHCPMVQGRCKLTSLPEAAQLSHLVTHQRLSQTTMTITPTTVHDTFTYKMSMLSMFTWGTQERSKQNTKFTPKSLTCDLK